MALVTVQRSPSPSNTPESFSTDLTDGLDESDTDGKSPRSTKSFSENYLAVKGAALILPQSECPRTVSRQERGGDILNHLQSMIYLLRPQDTIKVIVKLESVYQDRNRYLGVVSTIGRQDTEESVILGIDLVDGSATIGLVLPVFSDLSIILDGDGGFKIKTLEKEHIFKPVSVQSMWAALQSLNKVLSCAQSHHYFPKGLNHTWLSYYEVRVKSDQSRINEWNVMEDIESHRQEITGLTMESLEKEKMIRVRLKEVMLTVDLEEVTSKFIRTRLEEMLGYSLSEYRQFVDNEMIVILRQMDSPSQIFEHLYLGSEWNASNLQELRDNGIGYILNVTREIDNFFPGNFEYYNVRVFDVPASELMKHWDNTYKFIQKAKMCNSKVLVHCKMGVSRSASTVIAYAMKEFGWHLDDALRFVKEKRSCVQPNTGFTQQLITYQGILDASKQRHNMLWRRSSSMNNLLGEPREIVDIPISHDDNELRPRSWSPTDDTTQILRKAHAMGPDADSTDDEHSDTTDLPDFDTISEDSSRHPMPFPFDTWEYLDYSSRSTESIDEALPDEMPTPDPMQPEYHFDHTGVILLSHKPYDSERDLQKSEVSRDLADEGSDIEDFVAEDGGGKPQRGFYDVAMLTEFNKILQANEPELDSTGELSEEDKQLNLELLHPDMKLEMMMHEVKKYRRTAYLLRLSQEKHIKETSIPVIRTDNSTKVVRETVPAQFTKLRPDDSWIKDIPPSMDLADEDEGVFAPDTEFLDAGIQITVQSCTPTPEGTPNREIVQEEIVSASAQTAVNSAPKTSIDASKINEENGALKSNVDDVALEAGTVRRQAENLDSWIKSSSGSRTEAQDSCGSGISVSSCSDAGSSHGGSTEKLTLDLNRLDISASLENIKSVKEIAQELENIDKSTSPDSPRSTDSKSTGPLSPKGQRVHKMSECFDTISPPMSPREDSQLEKHSTTVSKSSIYEAEDIPLESGLVQRTKREFEDMHKCVESPSKPVQRSSSLKVGRKRPLKGRDRDNERRKTCLPLLTPYQVKDPSVSFTEADFAEDEERKRRAKSFDEVEYQRGKDARVIEASDSQNIDASGEDKLSPSQETKERIQWEGQVKKKKKDFESVVDTSKLLNIEQPSTERATSPLEEDVGLIRTGSVRKKTEEIERIAAQLDEVKGKSGENKSPDEKCAKLPDEKQLDDLKKAMQQLDESSSTDADSKSVSQVAHVSSRAIFQMGGEALQQSANSEVKSDIPVSNSTDVIAHASGDKSSDVIYVTQWKQGETKCSVNKTENIGQSVQKEPVVPSVISQEQSTTTATSSSASVPLEKKKSVSSLSLEIVPLSNQSPLPGLSVQEGQQMFVNSKQMSSAQDEENAQTTSDVVSKQSELLKDFDKDSSDEDRNTKTDSDNVENMAQDYIQEPTKSLIAKFEEKEDTDISKAPLRRVISSGAILLNSPEEGGLSLKAVATSNVSSTDIELRDPKGAQNVKPPQSITMISDSVCDTSETVNLNDSVFVHDTDNTKVKYSDIRSDISPEKEDNQNVETPTCGIPTYDEEGIPWSKGTVQNYRESIETHGGFTVDDTPSVSLSRTGSLGSKTDLKKVRDTDSKIGRSSSLRCSTSPYKHSRKSESPIKVVLKSQTSEKAMKSLEKGIKKDKTRIKNVIISPDKESEIVKESFKSGVDSKNGDQEISCESESESCLKPSEYIKCKASGSANYKIPAKESKSPPREHVAQSYQKDVVVIEKSDGARVVQKVVKIDKDVSSENVHGKTQSAQEIKLDDEIQKDESNVDESDSDKSVKSLVDKFANLAPKTSNESSAEERKFPPQVERLLSHSRPRSQSDLTHTIQIESTSGDSKGTQVGDNIDIEKGAKAKSSTPTSSQSETVTSRPPRKARTHGKSHPLTKLGQDEQSPKKSVTKRHKNPAYNTM